MSSHSPHPHSLDKVGRARTWKKPERQDVEVGENNYWQWEECWFFPALVEYGTEHVPTLFPEPSMSLNTASPKPNCLGISCAFSWMGTFIGNSLLQPSPLSHGVIAPSGVNMGICHPCGMRHSHPCGYHAPQPSPCQWDPLAPLTKKPGPGKCQVPSSCC